MLDRSRVSTLPASHLRKGDAHCIHQVVLKTVFLMAHFPWNTAADPTGTQLENVAGRKMRRLGDAAEP